MAVRLLKVTPGQLELASLQVHWVIASCQLLESKVCKASMKAVTAESHTAWLGGPVVWISTHSDVSGTCIFWQSNRRLSVVSIFELAMFEGFAIRCD